MEIDLKIISENNIILSNLNIENEEEETKEKKIKKSLEENIKNIISFSQEKIDTNYSFTLQKKNDKEYDVELKMDEIKEEINSKIESCSEKEKILNSKKEEFEKLQKDLVIDEKLLEKKLLSSIGVHKPEFDEIVNQVSELMLDYDNFNKEAALLQERIIKYRSSLILQTCFKYYWKRLKYCFDYIIRSYTLIFLYNEKIFKATCRMLPTLTRSIIDDLYGKILNIITKSKIYLKHIGDYQKNIKLYREFCYFFFILQSFDKNSEKIIFNVDKDLNLDFSENLYDNIGRFNEHILKRTGLNFPLEYFKELVNIDDIYESYFKKILLLYQKYKSFLPLYKKSGLLYE